jgi:RNA polymerase sigma-70 factor, ECF subfamily
MPLDSEKRARFDALVGAHGPIVMGVLVRFVRDRALAEDLWQDVFWSAWRRLDDLDRAVDPRPWLRTLAIHRAIDHVRRTRARPVVETGASLDERTAAPERRRADLEDDLAALPSHERAAILLHYQEGRSIAEIAIALDAPEGTVKTWLHRARRRLRARFEDEAAARKSAAKSTETER